MKKLIIVVLIGFLQLNSSAQKVAYSIVEREDNTDMNFEIIGKVGGNINIYKSFRNKHDLCIYDNEMQLKNRISLEFLPDRILNADFIGYADFSYMIYQYQKRGIVHCSMVKINGAGKLMTDPVDLDTSEVSGAGDNKVYSLIYSDDKKKIMLFKILRQGDKNFQITSMLFDNQLSLIKRNTFNLAGNTREGVFTDFMLDNDGDFFFGRCGRSGNRENINKLDIVYKEVSNDTIKILPIDLRDKTLDEVKLKIDNNNKKVLINAFFYKQKRGNIDGLFSMAWNKLNPSSSIENSFLFNDSLRLDAKGESGNLKTAFNDHFIRHVIPLQDGSYAVVTELFYSSSRSTPWNRYDYLFGNNMFFPYNPYYYYPMNRMYPWGYFPYNRFGAPSNMTRYISENIMVFYFNPEGKLAWSNTIRKSQFDDNTDSFISYQLFNTGNELRFLFNQREKRQLMLNSASIDADGKSKRQPTMKNLDSDYDFMPKYGKQIGLRQIILPCVYKNYICFANMEF